MQSNCCTHSWVSAGGGCTSNLMDELARSATGDEVALQALNIHVLRVFVKSSCGGSNGKNEVSCSRGWTQVPVKESLERPQPEYPCRGTTTASLTKGSVTSNAAAQIRRLSTLVTNEGMMVIN